MTKREYRRNSRLLFFFSIVFTGFLINALFAQSGWSRLISVSLFGFLVFQQIRVAFLMRRKAQELDLQ